MKALSRFILWDYPRASWQYDVMCVLILAFIFLTPRDLFRDQPKAANVVMLPADQGSGLFWIAPQYMDGVADPEQPDTATRLVNKQFKLHLAVVRVEPLKDAEGDVTGYIAYTQK